MTSKNLASPHFPAKGIPLVLIACVFNACMATSAKLLGGIVPAPAVVFSRLFISFLITLASAPFFMKQGLKRAIKVKSWTPTIVRIIANVLCLNTYFYAVQRIPLSLAIILVMTASLYIPLVMWIWKRTPIPPMIWWALGTGFIGVIFIVGPTITHMHWGIVCGLISGLLAGIAYAATRFQAQSETPFCVNFWLYSVGSLLALPAATPGLINTLPTLKINQWLLLVAVGLFGLLYQLFLIFAFKVTRARFIGSFLYFTLIFALCLDWYFFDKTPNLWNYIGILFIILGGVIMSFVDNAKKKA